MPASKSPTNRNAEKNLFVGPDKMSGDDVIGFARSR